MSSRDVAHYVEEALKKGASKDEISKQLISAGWAPDLVARIVSRYYGVDAHGVVIPTPRSPFHQIIRDIFVYVLTFVTIGLAASAVMGILFHVIDTHWAEVPKDPDNSFLNWMLSQLIVCFPIYTLLARWTHRDVRQNPEKQDSLVRKLMIYLILIVTALISLGTFIALLFNWLSGNLTSPFLLKAFTILAEMGIIFAYYFTEMRRDDRMGQARQLPEAGAV
jgi:hypothetical protein